MNDNVDRWELLHEQSRFCPLYPHEAVVSWTFRTFPRRRAGDFHLLDLGCGAGRHAVFWASEGYRVTAADPSTPGVGVTRERLKPWQAMAEAKVYGADAIDAPDAAFDGIVCYGVIYYLDFAGMQRSVAEMHRVLKPGGTALVITRTTKDSRFVNAIPAGDRSCRLGALPEGAPSSAEVGMLMTPLDRQGVDEVFAGFAQVNVDRMTVTSAGGSFIDDDWIVTATK